MENLPQTPPVSTPPTPTPPPVVATPTPTVISTPPQPTDKHVGIIIGVLVGLVFLLAITYGMFVVSKEDPQEAKDTAQSSSSTNDTKPSAEFIADVVKEIKTNIELPMEIDSVTTAVDITAEPTAIRYHYVLSSGFDAIYFSNGNFKNYLSSGVCENVDTKKLLLRNINMEYSYTLDSVEKYFFTITKADCSQ